MSGVYCNQHRQTYHGKCSFSWKTPVQSPNNAILCCKDKCGRLGMVGLCREEDAEYQKGELTFTCGYFIRV